MTNMLIKLFIRDYQKIDNPAVRARYGTLSGGTGIVLNLILFSIKLISGLTTASISIVADAFNNLSDAGSSLVTFLGFKLAQRPADDEHPFGHGRYEYVAGLAISIVIFLVGVELAKSSFDKILNPAQGTEFNLLTLFILLAAIGIKLWMFFFNKKLSKITESATMNATAMDSISDVVATSIVLVGLGVSYLIPGLYIDGYLGLIVAAFILYTGVTTVRDSLSPLLGKAPDPDFVRQIRDTVLADPNIVGIHDLIIHDYGPGRCIISLHAEVPCDADILKMHDAIDVVELKLKQRFHCTATIHMDPIAVHDEFTAQLRTQVEKLTKQVGEELTIHDFRVVRGDTHTNLIFDVAVPHRYPKTETQIANEIKQKIHEYDDTYFAVVQAEKLFLDTSKTYE